MMLIVGKGGEGKSRIGLVLKRLMGDAASNGSVQKVENNRFARADLERRLLMIDDDMDMNALPKTNYIKTIVTAEAKLDLERKGVQSYQRDIYARFLCFGNGALTSLYDHSDGFFRRQLILTTKDKPADRTDDPSLWRRCAPSWRASCSGVWKGCTGWCRTTSVSRFFFFSERAAANVDTIKRSSNNVIDFMESEAISASRRTTPSAPRSSTTFTSSGARTTPATAYRRSVSAQNCDRTTAAITLKPPTTSTCRWPQSAGLCGHRASCPPLSVKSAFFTEEVRTTCTVCTCTHPYGK